MSADDSRNGSILAAVCFLYTATFENMRSNVRCDTSTWRRKEIRTVVERAPRSTRLLPFSLLSMGIGSTVFGLYFPLSSFLVHLHFLVNLRHNLLTRASVSRSQKTGGAAKPDPEKMGGTNTEQRGRKKTPWAIRSMKKKKKLVTHHLLPFLPNRNGTYDQTVFCTTNILFIGSSDLWKIHHVTHLVVTPCEHVFLGLRGMRIACKTAFPGVLCNRINENMKGATTKIKRENQRIVTVCKNSLCNGTVERSRRLPQIRRSSSTDRTQYHLHIMPKPKHQQGGRFQANLVSISSRLMLSGFNFNFNHSSYSNLNRSISRTLGQGTCTPCSRQGVCKRSSNRRRRRQCRSKKRMS